MSVDEEEVKKLAELKAWLEERIKELELELEKMKEMVVVTDMVLRTSSFKSASELVPKKEVSEVRPLRRGDGKILANAYISGDTVSIVPVSDVRLSSAIPPFKSFCINRILEGMKTRDLELSSKGMLSKDEVLSYEIDEDDFIKKITVKGYGNRSRLNDILSSITWSFTKMLEKLPEGHG